MKLPKAFILSLTTSILLILGSYPVLALKVQLLPEKPQLGDTISVIVEESSTNSSLPGVSVDEKDYPVFPMADRENTYRALIPTSPLDTPGKKVVRIVTEEGEKNLGIWLEDRQFPIQSIRLTGAAAKPATSIELERVREFKNLVTPEKLWSGKFLRPSPARVSALFGVQRYINGKFAENYYHRGVDYAGDLGSPVFAPANGKIALVGKVSEGFDVHGNTVGIDHGQGVLSIFLHLEEIYVQEGDEIRAGQQIGTVGSTGASTGPHLHWGLYVNGVSVDPVPWRFEGID